MNEENAIEAERIGPERNIEELVGLLEQVETRKAELRRGKERRENIQYQQDRQIIPEQLPPVGQKPVILKPVQKHAVTQEEMGRLLQQQAETFQSQIRQLQKGLKARDSKPKPVRRAVRYEYDPNLEGWEDFPDPGPNPFDDEFHRKYIFDEIMGIPEQKIASKIAKRLRKNVKMKH